MEFRLFSLLRNYLLDSSRSTSTLFVTSFCILFSILLTVIVGVITTGSAIEHIFSNNVNDVFMDYFNNVMYSSDNPYTKWDVVYPAFLVIIYATIGRFTIPYNIKINGTVAELLRKSVMGIMSYYLLALIVIISTYWIFKWMCKDKITERNFNVLFILCIVSFPVLAVMDHGNCLLIAPALLAAFLAGYKSDNYLVKLLSYSAIGMLCGIAFFPVLFIILVLREKKIIDIITCIVIVAAVLVIPFYFTDGSISLFFSNLINNDNIIPEVVFDTDLKIITLLTYVVLLLIAIMAYFVKSISQWQLVTMISCGLMLGPGIDSEYSLVFVIIPFVMFVCEHIKLTTKMSYTYAVLFIIMVVVWPCSDYYAFDISIMIKWTTNIILLIVLLLDLSVSNIKKFDEKTSI